MKIKQEKMTLEKLAIMIKNGFDSVDKRFEGVDKRLDGIEKEIKEVKKDNTTEYENLKLRQDNVAYRFELIALG